MFRGPPWIVCWGNSSFADWRSFADSTKEGPHVEVAHFVRVCSVDSVVGRNEEPMTSALGIESSHDAQKDKVPFA